MLLLVVLSSFFLTFSSISKKFFKKECPFFFTAVCCFFALIVFLVISGFKFSLEIGVLPYAVCFALSYALCNLTMFLALKNGSLSVTNLVLSYSLILPTFYGVLYLNEKPSNFFYVGFVILAISIFLITYKKTQKEENQEKIKRIDILKWLIFLILAFVSNGFCSIIQTSQQKAFNGQYKSEFMLIALSISVVALLIVSLVTEKGKIKSGIKDAAKFGSISGIANGLLNFIVMISVNYLSASLVFPLISGLSLVWSFVFARVLFKEKYLNYQYIGFILSVASVVFMNL